MGKPRLAQSEFWKIIVSMSAREVIEQIKHLSPSERVQVVRYVVASEAPMQVGKAAVSVAGDGLPIIRGASGIITSNLVRELESLTP